MIAFVLRPRNKANCDNNIVLGAEVNKHFTFVLISNLTQHITYQVSSINR